jgi:hypothetical protein
LLSQRQTFRPADHAAQGRPSRRRSPFAR